MLVTASAKSGLFVFRVNYQIKATPVGVMRVILKLVVTGPSRYQQQSSKQANKQTKILPLIVCNGVSQSHWVKEVITQAIEINLPIIPLVVETSVEPFPGTRSFQSIDFTGNSEDPWQQLFDRLSNRQNSPRRRIEISYLQEILYRQELNKVEKVYTPLAGDQQQQIHLSKVLPEDCMPVEFELLSCPSKEQPAERETAL